MTEPTKDEIIANLEARLASLEEAFSKMEDWVIEFQEKVMPHLVVSGLEHARVCEAILKKHE